jgi:hypothetical protein
MVWFSFAEPSTVWDSPLQSAMISMFAERYMAMSLGNAHPRAAEVD